MARLLASAGETALRPSDPRNRRRPDIGAATSAPTDQAAPPVAPPVNRTVLEAGPDPEPEDKQPATLEALAARFSHRPSGPAKTKSAQTPADRSRQEREKQAAILARLRGQA